MTKAYKDIYYNAPDGLTLYARDYGGDFNTPVLLCMHGLTRNSADFHNLALNLKDRYRIIAVDQRGRGLSASDPKPQNYRPDIYCADMFALLQHINVENVIAIGTSMGGLMTMMMSAMQPGIFKAAIINDIGPDIDPAGLDRIKGYVGGTHSFDDWESAKTALKSQGPEVFPEYSDTDWANFAQRTCTKQADGRVHYSYDPAISQPFKTEQTVAAPPDLWPIFETLSLIPLLIIRGSLSDILALKTALKMQSRHPKCFISEIPNIGHAPMLDEPKSVMDINAFLESLT